MNSLFPTAVISTSHRDAQAHQPHPILALLLNPRLTGIRPTPNLHRNKHPPLECRFLQLPLLAPMGVTFDFGPNCTNGKRTVLDSRFHQRLPGRYLQHCTNKVRDSSREKAYRIHSDSVSALTGGIGTQSHESLLRWSFAHRTRLSQADKLITRFCWAHI